MPGRIEEIIDFNRPVKDIIEDLRDKTVCPPLWENLRKKYYPREHKVLEDKVILRDKIRKDGTTEKSARIALGYEKLLANRFSDFTFAIPVKRIYEDGGENQDIIKAIEKIYEKARIDTENRKRGEAFYASCEIFTMWYAVKKKNNLYGFDAEYKLKCKTYSPMDGVKLYPIINELDDMIAMSFEYQKRIKDEVITYFETYTEDRHYIWRQTTDSGKWEEILYTQTEEDGERVSGEEIQIMKIPGVYAWRKHPVYEDIGIARKEMEYTLSRNSNILAYNSAPVLKVAGALAGQEKKDESYRLWRVENGGDVQYVSWQQSIDALKFHVETMESLIFKLAQIPDISFEKMASLGNIGYDARKTLLTEVRLRITSEAGEWEEFLDREFNVIKAFLKLMNRKWADRLDDIACEHVITPYVPNDESAEIDMRMKANGGKPLESHLESIIKFGEAKDAQKTLEEIREEERQEQASKATSFAQSNSLF